MDELIRNLKTYELKKQQDQDKKEPKREKSLSLKATKFEYNEDNEDVIYLAQIFFRSMKRKGGFQKGETLASHQE